MKGSKGDSEGEETRPDGTRAEETDGVKEKRGAQGNRTWTVMVIALKLDRIA